ncbi:MAG: hypothetical protein M3O62_15970 [Pseudomonadota bacterium]|nr:hypothetical protein [Pseudomonadota bacterium]
MSKQRIAVAGALGVVCATAGLLVWNQQSAAPESVAATTTAMDCPAGYIAADPVEVSKRMNPDFAAANAAQIRERFGTEFCTRKKLPRSQAKKFAESDAVSSVRGIADGDSLRRAVEAKEAAMALQPKIANAVGNWSEYGTGPLSSDENFQGSVDGIPEVNGRTDQFAYDPEARRLFAAVGNGGIWMSTAKDGDIGTLGDEWQAIGDRLPTLITSGVGWTPAGGGRVIALTGEHTQGGNSYVGLGAYWSDDLGATWHHASGVPDAALGFRVEVDPAHPEIVYVATGKGLFRSEDAGSSYTNVALPVSEACAGVETLGPCQFANFVTDVVIKHPGGSTDFNCAETGCPVLAAVGFRSGAAPYPDGTPQAPGNGLYRSVDGKAGSFGRVGVSTPTGLVPLGFTPNERIGRIELGIATGPEQNHDYVYAIVQDAVLLNGGFPIIDIPLDNISTVEVCNALKPVTDAIDPTVHELCALVLDTVPSPTTLNGVYASSDFGETWTRLVDDTGLILNGLPAGSSLVATAALGVGPGIQSWYNAWIKPDPTQQIAGMPTRLAFGLEELWQNRLPLPPLGLVENTPLGWDSFGTYFAGDTCLFLLGNAGLPGIPFCPFRDGLTYATTTHPDQQDGLFIPDPERGGVWLFAGNDGGVYRQHSAGIADPLANNQWGNGVNRGGFYTLMNYGIAMANDGTVYFGLQDNTSGKIDPESRRQIRIYIGDGMWAAVDPENSDTAYYQTPGLALVRTTDGGRTNTYIDTFDVGAAHFLSPFVMDARNADHLVAAGTKVAETTNASAEDISWTTVFDLGLNPDTSTPYQARFRSLDTEGDAVYVAYCSPCNLAGASAPFRSGIATNVGGDAPPKSGTPDGWHHAAAAGLPNRFIYGIEIDAQDPRTVYVTLGGYSTARWAPPGQYLDENPAIGQGSVYKSTDAGASFTDISGNLPQTNVTSILRRGEQLIVGSDLGVFISADLAGSAWAPLGNLPSVPVNQIALKPDDDRILLAGTFGRGVHKFDFAEATDGGTTGGTTGGDKPRDAGRFGASSLSLYTVLLLLSAGLLRRRALRAK